jgi:hypothetical protein
MEASGGGLAYQCLETCLKKVAHCSRGLFGYCFEANTVISIDEQRMCTFK